MRGLFTPTLDSVLPKLALGALAYGGYKALSEGSDEYRGMVVTGGLGAAGAYGAYKMGAAGMLGRAGLQATKGLANLGGAVIGGAGRKAVGAIPGVIGTAARGIGHTTHMAGGLGLFAVNALAGNPFGGPRKAKDLRGALKLLFPYVNEGHILDASTGKMLPHPRKFALSTNIGRRLVAGAVVAGAVSAVGDAFSNNAPAPTVFHDGTSLRQMNDLGANANYGRAVLGRNSNL